MPKTKERMEGMERTRFLVACGISIVAAIVVITATLLVLNMQPGTPNSTGIVISGQMACLPHKTTDAPQTQECALGLRADDNRYYALKNIDQAIITAGTGTRVTVHGTLSTTTDNTYDIVGTIQAASLTRP